MSLRATHFEPHTHPDGNMCYTVDCEYRDSEDIQDYDRKSTATYTVTFASGSVETFPFEDLINFVSEWGLDDIKGIARDSDSKVIYYGTWTRNATSVEKKLLNG